VIDPLIAARAIHLAATAMVAGGTLFTAVNVAPAGACPAMQAYLRWLRVYLWASLVLVILSGAGWLVAVAANIDAPAWVVLAKTGFGHVWITRLVLALALLGVMGRRQPGTGLSALLGMSLMGSLAWSGHAAGSPGGLGEIHRAADILHLCACGAWLGGLAPLALLIVVALRQTKPAIASFLQIAVRRFSAIGLLSVATLLATGLLNTGMLAGSLSALLGTDYGNLLLLKIALFGVMVTLAAINRVRLTPALPREAAARGLARNALIEFSLGGAIIVIVAILGTLPPPVHMFM
jgi:putative copper resistance protein D